MVPGASNPRSEGPEPYQPDRKPKSSEAVRAGSEGSICCGVTHRNKGSRQPSPNFQLSRTFSLASPNVPLYSLQRLSEFAQCHTLRLRLSHRSLAFRIKVKENVMFTIAH